jgi:TPP-dependent pyruvate/acetoin dehydrogenase alpha subunit
VNDVRAKPPYPTPPSDTPPPLGSAVPRPEHPDKAEMLRLARYMITARSLEDRFAELYRLGEITGGVYTAPGNEATSVGTASALGADDVLVPTHRDLGAHLVRGHALIEVVRQFLKKATSQTGGRDSGLHLGREGSNIIGMISHLAHMLPVAVGVALAERQRGRRSAVLASVGDGATSLGDFHEALNFAAVEKLPILFVIQNNQYAYSTPVTLQYACERLSDRAVGYGMPGAQIDGTDVIAVLRASKEAIERARSGGGPTLLECVTMRMRGHSEHDDFKYAPPGLLERWKRWDPIDRLLAYISAERIESDRGIAQMKADISAEIDRAVEEAERDPSPDPAAADKDVFRLWKDEWTVPR